MKQEQQKNSALETGISLVLITGVIVSLLLEIAGVILYYRQYGNLELSQSPEVFIQGRDFFSFFYRQISGQADGGLAVRLMTLGLAVLMLTPFTRVIMSFIFFSREKNLKYIWITLFVLVVLTLSLAFH